MKVKLTFNERVQLEDLMSAYKGNMLTFKALRKFREEVLAFSDEEIERFEIRAFELPSGGKQYTWNPQKVVDAGENATEKEIDVPKRLIQPLTMTVEQLEGRGMLGGEFEGLYDKLFPEKVEEMQDRIELLNKVEEPKTEKEKSEGGG